MRNLPPVAWLGWVAIVAVVASVWWFRRRAPAVALGLTGLLAGALVQARGGFDPTWWGDPPLVGLMVMGVSGLVFVPRAGPIYLLKASVIALFGAVIAPPLAYLFFHWSCPAWAPVVGVARARPWCNGVWDVLPVFRATLFVGAEAVVLLLLFVASAFRASRHDVEDAPVNVRRRRLVLAAATVIVVGIAVCIARTTPRPPRVEAEVAADGTWTTHDCDSVPLFVGGGLHRRCLAGAGSAAFTLSLRSVEGATIMVRGCDVTAMDADGTSLSPHPASVPTYISAGAAHGDLLLHPGDLTTFSWYVNGVPAGSIASYVTNCDAVFASGPRSSGS